MKYKVGDYVMLDKKLSHRMYENCMYRKNMQYLTRKVHQITDIWKVNGKPAYVIDGWYSVNDSMIWEPEE